MTMLNNLPQSCNCSYTNIHQRELSAMERHEDESNKKMFPIICEQQIHPADGSRVNRPELPKVT